MGFVLNLLILGASGLMLGCSTAWRMNINGTANGSDYAGAVTLTDKNDVVAAGATQNTGSGFGFTVVKLSKQQGRELWRRVINGTANPPITGSHATGVTIAGGKDVIAVGSIAGAETSDDGIVVKFDGASGTELWRQVITGKRNGSDLARSVVLDSSGNVITAGYTSNLRPYHDLTVIKFDGAKGTELWRQIISGSENGASEAVEVAVDARGDLVVVGFIWNLETAGDLAVAKLNGASGAVQWRTMISGTSRVSFDMAHAVSLDLAGDVSVAGYLRNSLTEDDFTVIKFDGTSGAERWRKSINGTSNGVDRALALAVDLNGNVVAVGHIRNAETLDDFFVIKLDGITGSELWRQTINGDTNSDDWARTVALDLVGDVVAAGATQNRLTGTDFTVVRFNGASGRELWRTVINGTAHGVDAALAITTDAPGNVVGVGSSENTATGDDFIVIKLTH